MSSFIDNKKKYDQIIQETDLLENSYVTFGFQEGTVTHSQTKGKRKKSPGLSLAQIAAQNEFGTKKIPARPFMSTSFDENRDKFIKVINDEYTKIINGQSNVKKSLNLLGILGVNLIQQKIRAIQNPPNSPKTIAIKGSSKPLIDFGQMIQSVRHKVVIK